MPQKIMANMPGMPPPVAIGQCIPLAACCGSQSSPGRAKAVSSLGRIMPAIALVRLYRQIASLWQSRLNVRMHRQRQRATLSFFAEAI